MFGSESPIERLKVGPVTYTVEPNADEVFEPDNMGQTHHRTKRVVFDPRQPATDLPLTILHEALHAMGHAYGIDYWRGHGNKDNEIDQFELMTTAIAMLMRDNPELIAWIQETR